jgi:hypothetical protein
MKIVPLILFLFFWLTSCSGNRLPKNILPPEKMKLVMWDLSLSDELVNYHSARDSAWMGNGKHREYYEKVFAIHKISQEDFARSLEYYESHPPLLKTVLDSMQKYGERKLSVYDTIKRKSLLPDTIRHRDRPSIDSLKKKHNLIRGL